jgi:hypothetical protein
MTFESGIASSATGHADIVFCSLLSGKQHHSLAHIAALYHNAIYDLALRALSQGERESKGSKAASPEDPSATLSKGVFAL